MDVGISKIFARTAKRLDVKIQTAGRRQYVCN